jgi:hypothetical protein
MSLIALLCLRYTCSSFVKKCKLSYDFETFILYVNSLIVSTSSSKNRSRITFVLTMKCKTFKWFRFRICLKIDVTDWNKDKEFIIVVRRLLTKHRYRRVFFLFNKRMMWRKTSRIKLWCEYYYCRHDIF